VARFMAARYELKGTLTGLDAIHIGGAGNDPTTDMSLGADGAGRHYIPGTSLAGPLRARCRRQTSNGVIS